MNGTVCVFILKVPRFINCSSVWPCTVESNRQPYFNENNKLCNRILLSCLLISRNFFTLLCLVFVQFFYSFVFSIHFFCFLFEAHDLRFVVWQFQRMIFQVNIKGRHLFEALLRFFMRKGVVEPIIFCCISSNLIETIGKNQHRNKSKRSSNGQSLSNSRPT